MQVSRKEIQRVEGLLLPEGDSFFDEREERYKVIECLERSIEVNACPGSGKTTCLLAKLILLAERMAFPDGRGICVLTHTNVAIDEVKRTIGTKANKLFNYPNHFGTFQTFVDKFLAIPYYKQTKGKAFGIIEDSVFNESLKIRYMGLPWNVRRYLERRQDPLEYLQNLRFSRDGNKLLTGFDGKIAFTTDGLVSNSLLVLKKHIFEDGILCFDDAYSLAFQYLNKLPRLKKIVSSRFRYVFIDEMQDSYPQQTELIDALFDETVIVQKIGDPDQAIYGEGPSPQKEGRVWKPSENALQIASSKRFSNSIAKVLRTVCVKNNLSLVGNKAIDEIPPYIITYKKETIENVIEKYVELVHKYGIDKKSSDNIPIAVVGWVGDGKAEKKTTIQSYFKGYNKRLKRSSRPHFESLKSYLQHDKMSSVKVYHDNIIEGILRILYLCGRKEQTSKGERYFTKTSVLRFMREKEDLIIYKFSERVSKWSKMIHNHNSIFNQAVLDEVRTYFRNDVPLIFNVTLNGEAGKFIDSDVEPEFTMENLENKNYYPVISKKLKHIKVKVENVHSAKGKTHAATLYLETSYQGFTCSEYIIDQLTGLPYNPDKVDNKKNLKKYRSVCLKMAYVGMSRPKYFLAFAAREDRILPKIDDLKKNGWEIVQA